MPTPPNKRVVNKPKPKNPSTGRVPAREKMEKWDKKMQDSGRGMTREKMEKWDKKLQDSGREMTRQKREPASRSRPKGTKQGNGFTYGY